MIPPVWKEFDGSRFSKVTTYARKKDARNAQRKLRADGYWARVFEYEHPKGYKRYALYKRRSK